MPRTLTSTSGVLRAETNRPDLLPCGTAQTCMARKLELVNAEGLFDLDTTEYPELQRVVSELKKLGRIYDLYQEQRQFEDGNSATPWGDLDVASLQRGVEILEKKARKEKQFKEHPTFRAVEGRIFNFKDSIPLIVNLKNEAMKPRHWQKLIEVRDRLDAPSSIERVMQRLPAII